MDLKKTKIVATISDKNCEVEFLRSLYEAGMNVVRINSAHLNQAGALKIINNVRAVSDKIAILLDTKGPEIRTVFSDEPVVIKKDALYEVVGEPEGESKGSIISVTYDDFEIHVPVGARVLIDDGDVELVVLEKNNGTLLCKASNDGLVGSKKSVNVPGVKINLPSVSERDKEFLKFAVENGVDFIAHSFVRSAQDVIDLKNVIRGFGGDIKIIAKIENQEGVDNLDEILEEVYGVMVARGDLAIEIPYEKIPVIQKMIISKCIALRKPVIVATQMLHSMITNPRPTRAEVSDIASAIYSQTDAIMLSGETASGKYPLESVKTMTRVAMEVEQNKDPFLDIPCLDGSIEISSYLAKTAVRTAVRLKAKGIIADTELGRSIRDMAAYRGNNLILAQCYSKRTMRELALSYGVYTSYQVMKNSVDEFMHVALKYLLKPFNLKDDDLIIVLAGNFLGTSGFSFIEVGSVQYLKDRVSIIEE